MFFINPCTQKSSISFLKILLTFFIFSNNSVFGQTNIIDEENFSKTLFHVKRDTDSVLFYVDRLKQSKNQCRVLFAKLFEAGNYYVDNKYEACVAILNDILNEIDTNPKPNTFIYSDLMVGKNYTECVKIIKLNVYRRFFHLRKNEKKLTEAYDYLLLMKDIVNNLEDKNTYYLKNKISITFSLASLKKVIGQKEESLEILLKLNKEIDSIGIEKNNIWYNDFQKEKANINVQISRNYMHLGKKKSEFFVLAELHLNKAYAATQTIDSNLSRNITAHYLRMAELNTFKENYSLALKLTDTISKHLKKGEFNSALYTIKSISHSKLKHPDSAIYYANKMVNNKKHVGIKYNFTDLYNTLTENYFVLNQLDSAQKYSELTLQTIKNKTLNEKKVNSVLSEKKISEMVLLNITINKKREFLKYSLITFASASFIFIIILSFFSFKKSKSLKQKVEVFKKELDQLQESTPTKKESAHTIDNETTNRILTDLANIEDSTIFLNKDFSLNVLAKLLKTNTSYLSRIINDHKQKTFKQYLIELRINVLLKNLDEDPIMQKYSIEALAESIGYKNASSFTRIFKNHTGVSPSEYLKKKYAS